MEWQFALSFFLGSLALLMVLGVPVAFCFLLITLMGGYIFMGGEVGIIHVVRSLKEAVSHFTMAPVVLFILMGELAFHSGLAPAMIDALDKWIGRVPGRLSFEGVAAGTMFATLSGSGIAAAGVLGSTLVPEMEKRGYRKPMSLGPLLGSGGLALMIPPSNFAVLFGAIAEVSIDKILIAIVVPGFAMAILYAAYILVRCSLQPHLAPAYSVPSIPLSQKLLATAVYILPLGLILFLIIGFIFLGIATPTEAAATGTVGAFILVAAHRRLTWGSIRNTMIGTIQVAGMAYMILLGAIAFNQVLAFSGASQGLTEFVVGLGVSRLSVIILMQLVLMFMGCFMDQGPIMMITAPIFMPIVHAIGIDPVWFAVVVLLNMEIAATTPPFGFILYVMKGVAPPDTTFADLVKAALPFLGCDMIVLILLFLFPQIALWLPSLIRG